MQRLSRKSYKNLDGVKAIFIAILTESITDSPFDFGIPKDGGVRSDKRQEQLYGRGRSRSKMLKKGLNPDFAKPNKRKITWTLNSLHKPNKLDGMGYAVDFFAYVNGRASWDMRYMKPIARHIQNVAKEKFNIDIEWGYDLWHKDGAHIQIKR